MPADAALVLDKVEATLNYIAPTVGKPYVYTYAPPAGVAAENRPHAPHRVAIEDARPFARQLTLDKSGFELRRHATQVKDFYDEAEVRRVYYPEIERLLIEATGARQIVIFDHTVRNSDPRQRETRGVREAAMSVHVDYTFKSAPQRVRDLVPPEEAEKLLQGRVAQINVWRSIAGPVEAWPLALAEASSIAESDLVASERRYPGRVGEIYNLRYSPQHRWFYFPRLKRDEALLIKSYDSAEDGRARLAAHTAFEDPTTPETAPPRESIEVRAFAFF